jgi:formate hydrogenlyase subunit 3/multisubunit Na+/H+ antiporter MnhD subunit
LGPAFLLLLLGGVAAQATRLWHRVGQATEETAKTWGMRVGLGSAIIGSATIAAIAVGQLVSCHGGAECAHAARLFTVSPPVVGAGTEPLTPGLDVNLRLDGLAALFLLVVAVCGGCVAVYSFGWLRMDRLRNAVAGSFCLFLLATMLTIVVDSVLGLLFALEIMTLCSADLVRYKGLTRGFGPASRNAMRTYLIVSHVGLLGLLVGVLPIVVDHGTWDMGQLRGLGSPAPAFSFAFILLGLAIRAGVSPFHVWVPSVHPELPTNTHAMVSAVMLKIPVYLMFRFFLGGIIGPVQWWWGALVLVLGGVTAIVTVFYALLSTDLKVALAYHSVENIGIILAGLGLGMLFSDDRFGQLAGVHAAAGLALLASLYHVVNHALFKSLLFLAAGSIERHVDLGGTIDLRRLGGLARLLPWTAFTFLAGSIAMAELPPLNGFVSVWLTMQAMFAGQDAYRTSPAIALTMMTAVAVALVALAMAFAATAFAFAKISGEALLGNQREPLSVAEKEPWSMRGVLAGLAGLCLLLGIQPWLLVSWLKAGLAPLYDDLSGLTASPTRVSIDMPGLSGASGYHASLPVLPVLVLLVVPALLTALIRLGRWRRRPVWVGGSRFDATTMQHSGQGLSALLWERSPRRRAAVRQPSVTGDGERADLPHDGADRATSPFADTVMLSARYTVVELANSAYNTLVRAIDKMSTWFGRRLQNGDVRTYLLYVFATVVLALVILAVIS